MKGAGDAGGADLHEHAKMPVRLDPHPFGLSRMSYSTRTAVPLTVTMSMPSRTTS